MSEFDNQEKELSMVLKSHDDVIKTMKKEKMGKMHKKVEYLIEYSK